MWGAWQTVPVSGNWWVDGRITHQKRPCPSGAEDNHEGDWVSLRNVTAALAATPAPMLPAADVEILDRFATALVEGDEYAEGGPLSFPCVPLAAAFTNFLPICELASFTVPHQLSDREAEGRWSAVNRLAGWIVPHVECQHSEVVIRKGWGW